MIQVEDALDRAGYTMVDDIHVDDDQFTAIAKGQDNEDVRVTLDMNSLAVLKIEPLPLTLP
jgi:hypothetical protein